MELTRQTDKTIVPRITPVVIAAPQAGDGAGTALRRAFQVPGALPDDLARLLGALNQITCRSAD